MSASIYTEYFQLTREYQSQYGENTVLLMQVGAFFEIYGLKNPDNGEITHSQIVPISQICQLNMSEKKTVYEGSLVMMAGFRDYTLEKFLQKITDNDFTAVVYVQEKNEKNTKRIFHSVHSAGTYISFETDHSPQITNNIMCIWLELETFHNFSLRKGERNIVSGKDNIICGISVANIFTGKSFFFEYHTPFYSNPTTFDELERFVSIYAPSEVLLLSPFPRSTLDMIIQYCGIKTNNIHRIYTQDESDPHAEKALRCTQQTYIHHILSTFYGEEILNICSEFQMHAFATQAFCYLMNFIQEHNPNLVRNISLPVFNNTTDRMILANHTLKQLNIIDDPSVEGCRGVKKQLSSVLSFLNKCCCAMGKRRFQHQLLNPTFNETWLQEEYDVTEAFLQTHKGSLTSMRKRLGQICDIEKLCRQLTIQKIYPSSIYSLYRSVESILELHAMISELPNPILNDYLGKDIVEKWTDISRKGSDFCRFLNENLDVELCKTVSSLQTFEQNIIRKGVSLPLDALHRKQANHMKLFDAIREQLNQLMKSNEGNSGGNPSADIEYVKIHETEKMGMSLQITKKRGSVLKTILSGMKNVIHVTCEWEDDEGNMTTETHAISDIRFHNASTSTDELDSHLLKKVTKDLLHGKEKINEEIAAVFSSFVKRIEKEWFRELELLAAYVAKLDVLQSKAYIALEYNYVKPVISAATTPETPFVKAMGLRHCLIEQIQTHELYVPNDVVLDDETKGILLYGTNAVGKTSIIRALGIAVILAQAGLYVPCSHFLYKPYTAIYSRILGNDNLFKGLSTFAVEMSELRTILKMADEKSLILGDELCSGTETESALSIFVTGLMDLSAKRASFIFATHFHEIVHYEEIAALAAVKCKHLSVYYDREKDCLIYDRKLKEGSGTRMYGLEVCKSLYLPEEFLETAYSIRNKYFPQTRGELLHTPATKYNAHKIRGKCEICGETLAAEIHHMREQREANEDGFIENFHKNHPANLMSVCEKCHDRIHATATRVSDVEVSPLSLKPKSKPKMVRKKTTKGYKVMYETPTSDDQILRCCGAGGRNNTENKNINPVTEEVVNQRRGETTLL